jgi:hypothetical protein
MLEGVAVGIAVVVGIHGKGVGELYKYPGGVGVEL